MRQVRAASAGLGEGRHVKIVDRATFLALPKGTLYSDYRPCVFGELLIKDESWAEGFPERPGDFLYQDIVGSIAVPDGVEHAGFMIDACDRSLATGSSIPMDFDSLSRDGMFEREALFAVWERDDVISLILRLAQALTDQGR
jgi:hypothetical protein